jgi:hypothetical protein
LEFRVEKLRIEAVIHLSNWTRIAGDFFVAQVSPTLFGQERVAELLNRVGIRSLRSAGIGRAPHGASEPRAHRDGRGSKPKREVRTHTDSFKDALRAALRGLRLSRLPNHDPD